MLTLRLMLWQRWMTNTRWASELAPHTTQRVKNKSCSEEIFTAYSKIALRSLNPRRTYMHSHLSKQTRKIGAPSPKHIGCWMFSEVVSDLTSRPEGICAGSRSVCNSGAKVSMKAKFSLSQESEWKPRVSRGNAVFEFMLPFSWGVCLRVCVRSPLHARVEICFKESCSCRLTWVSGLVHTYMDIFLNVFFFFKSQNKTSVHVTLVLQNILPRKRA